MPGISNDGFIDGVSDYDMPAVPTYQGDFYGWGLRIIDRVGDWLTQLMSSTLFLVGQPRNCISCPFLTRDFPPGRPDIFGPNWRESIPFIPREQVQHPDPEDLKMATKPYTTAGLP